VTDDVQVIKGPAPAQNGGVIYQVTLAQGLILTNPQSFGEAEPMTTAAPGPIITQDGRVLAPLQRC